MNVSKLKKICALAAVFLFSAAAVFSEERPENLRDYINAKISSGERSIKIPAGTYRLKSEKRQHLVFRNLKDVYIDARGVKLICLDTTRAVTIDKCENFTLDGLWIDYDPLPFTQGKIVKISDDKTVTEVEIFNGYPDAGEVEISPDKYEIFNPQTRRLRTWDSYSNKINVLSDKKFEVIRPYSRALVRRAVEQVGDHVVTAVSNIKHPIPHAVMLSDCKNVKLKGIKLYAAHGFGYFEESCTATVYEDCLLDRCPPEVDILKREFPRLRSGNADGFHSKYSQNGPVIINCRAMYGGDDCIAISGRYYHCVSAKGNILRMATFVDSMNFDVGDEVEIFSPRTGALEYSKVKSIVDAQPLTEEEFSYISSKIFPRTVYRTSNLKRERIKVYTIELQTAPQKLDPESMICAVNKIGNGFKILGGAYGNNRSRGMLLRASNGLVKGAKIEGARMAGILCAPEIYWYGAGHSRSVSIEDCNIEAGMYPAICVYSMSLERKFSPAGAHRDIKITGNRIRGFYAPLVFLSSIKNLTFSGNTIEKDSKPYYEHEFFPWPVSPEAFGWDGSDIFKTQCD